MLARGVNREQHEDSRMVEGASKLFFERHGARVAVGLEDYNNAAVLVLLPIYAAGEHPLPGVTAERLAAQINKFGHRDVNYAESFEEAQRILEEKLREGDLLITLGAGDVWKIGDEFLETTDEYR